jgi:hypothetical protein
MADNSTNGTATGQSTAAQPPAAPPNPDAPREQPRISGNHYSVARWIVEFTNSGIFFMIVGTLFLYVAFDTIEKTHAAMTFVLVVVGVAILLYGTGTQGIGHFDSGEKLARYRVALAGGAGVLAFCVAAGIIAFSPKMKEAFRVEQRYVRFIINAKGGYEKDDVGRYVPDIRINGTRVPAVRKGDHIEVYVPYIVKSEPASLYIRADLYLVEKAGTLTDHAYNYYTVEVAGDGAIKENGKDRGKFNIDAGLDFPRYTLVDTIDIAQHKNIAGVEPQ